MPPPESKHHLQGSDRHRRKHGDRPKKSNKERTNRPRNKQRRSHDDHKNNHKGKKQHSGNNHVKESDRDRPKKAERSSVTFSTDADIEKQSENRLNKNANLSGRSKTSSTSSVPSNSFQTQLSLPVTGKTSDRQKQACCRGCRLGCACVGGIIFLIIVGAIGVVVWLVIIPPATTSESDTTTEGKMDVEPTFLEMELHLRNWTTLSNGSVDENRIERLACDLIQSNSSSETCLNATLQSYRNQTANGTLWVKLLLEVEGSTHHQQIEADIKQALADNVFPWIFGEYQIAENGVILTTVTTTTITTTTTSTATSTNVTITDENVTMVTDNETSV